MKWIKIVIYSIKMFFKIIIDTWKSVNQREKEIKEFSRYLKPVKEYQKEKKKDMSTKRGKTKSRCCGATIGVQLTNYLGRPAIIYCKKCERELNALNQPIKKNKENALQSRLK